MIPIQLKYYYSSACWYILAEVLNISSWSVYKSWEVWVRRQSLVYQIDRRIPTNGSSLIWNSNHFHSVRSLNTHGKTSKLNIFRRVLLRLIRYLEWFLVTLITLPSPPSGSRNNKYRSEVNTIGILLDPLICQITLMWFNWEVK